MKILGYTLNKIDKDEFGRKSGILALDKPPGITSHDLVYRVRKKIGIKKVGHAGALDPFATGLMLLLVGKATKLSERFLTKNKEYEFDILLGVSTDTQDPEGNVTAITELQTKSEEEINRGLNQFKGEYYQYVPVFSSVKVDGIRLRELAHNASGIKKEQRDDGHDVCFSFDKQKVKNRKIQRRMDKNSSICLEIPRKKVEISTISLIGSKKVKASSISFLQDNVTQEKEFMVITIRSRVSKGTYIRQLAEDIGEKLGNIPAVLIALRRTKIGDIALSQAIDIDSLT